MKYIGLDIHKKKTQACVMDKKRKIVLIKRVRTDVTDIGHLFKMIEDDTKDELAVVMEATGFYFWIHDLIVARGHDVKVVHPNRAKELMKAKSKTDKNDAFMPGRPSAARCSGRDICSFEGDTGDEGPH
jgi:transposase